MKTTRWFPTSTRPVRPGVYQTVPAGSTLAWYAQWTGEHWCVGDFNVQGASADFDRTTEMGAGAKWRGLAKKPEPIEITRISVRGKTATIWTETQ